MKSTSSCSYFLAPLLAVLLLHLSPAPLVAQTSWYVDDDAPGDPGPGDPSISDPLEDGSIDHPFDAIQEGIDAAVNGDTVLVADGTYTETGNWDMSFLGKAITVASDNGPDACIIDGQGSWDNEHFAFMFDNGEGNDAILCGFTITDFTHQYPAAGINCYETSPTIIGNVLSYNEGFDGGGAMTISGGPGAEASPLIIGNVFTENFAEYSGGIFIYGHARPLIFNNLLYSNYAADTGMGDTGAIYCFSSGPNTCMPLIVGRSIVDNYGTGYASGIYGDDYAEITVHDSIIRGNSNGQINAVFCTITWSNVEGGFPGTGNIDLDPIFVSGPDGDYYLSQLAAGQGADSPCLDAGSDLAVNICATLPDGDICLGDATTRTDQLRDAGQADMGYHYTALVTISATLGCVPASGTLPFQTLMTVELENVYTGITRRIAGRINVKLASGQGYASWRAGYTNVGPGDTFTTSWFQTIPALGTLVGDNRFSLEAEDVTPPPYNQPPYPPSGDTARSGCTVTGVAP